MITLDELAEIIERCMDGDPVTLDEGADFTLEELGIDSLAVFDATTEIQTKYKVELSFDDVSAAGSPKQLLDIVNKAIRAKR